MAAGADMPTEREGVRPPAPIGPAPSEPLPRPPPYGSLLGRRDSRNRRSRAGARPTGASSSETRSSSRRSWREVVKTFDIPTLVMHGEDDQIVPVKDSAKKSAKLIRGAQEIYYPGAPHGLTATLQDRVNADLLAFLKSAAKTAAA